MQVTSLSIEARSKYAEYAEPFRGMVTLEGINGKQEVRLSDITIANIFSIIKEQVSGTAKHNAKQVSHAVQSASDSTLLIENSSMAIENEEFI